MTVHAGKLRHRHAAYLVESVWKTTVQVRLGELRVAGESLIQVEWCSACAMYKGVKS